MSVRAFTRKDSVGDIDPLVSRLLVKMTRLLMPRTTAAAGTGATIAASVASTSVTTLARIAVPAGDRIEANLLVLFEGVEELAHQP